MKIWKTVVDFWNEISPADVARAFILAYRVMRLIIKESGNNSWLSHGALTAMCGETSKIPLLA
jgi:hypothetical protein